MHIDGFGQTLGLGSLFVNAEMRFPRHIYYYSHLFQEEFFLVSHGLYSQVGWFPYFTITLRSFFPLRIISE